MSLEMGVVPAGAELSRATTVALLGRLLGDDPDLHEGVAKGEFAEMELRGERISSLWSVYPGGAGISSVVVSIWDAFPLRPAEGFRAEVTPIIELLQQLAQSGGGRFVVEEGDVTGATLAEVLSLISSDDDSRTPAGLVLGTTAETDEDYMRRYLAAGNQRLAWLRDNGGQPRLDYSRESLAPLWEWAISRLQFRPGDAGIEKVILENGSVFQRPLHAVLPMWYGRSAFLAPVAWSDDALQVIDAVAFYAVECVRHAVPGLAWKVGHEDERGYTHEGQPVVAGRGPDLEPVTSLIPLAGKVARHLREPDTQERPSGNDLQQWFDEAVAQRR